MSKILFAITNSKKGSCSSAKEFSNFKDKESGIK